MRGKVLDVILENKIIAIARGLNEENVVKVAKAIYEGGIRCLEVTFDQTDENHLINTPNQIKALVQAFGDTMCIGAGTVLTFEQLDMAHQAGALYMISPNVDVEIIRKAKELGMVVIPGAYTPTEIVTAYNAGADLIKVFPAEPGGISYIKAIRAPLKHIPLVAVGGVDEKNIKEYMDTGVFGVGIGDKILRPDWIQADEFSKITELAKLFVRNIK